MNATPVRPVKTREFQNHHFDSTIWNDFEFRDDDNHRHLCKIREQWYAAMNDTAGRVGPPITPPPADVRQYWREWFGGDGYSFWPFWENVRTFWDGGAQVLINQGVNGRWAAALTGAEITAYEARAVAGDR